MYDLAVIGAGWAGFNAAVKAKEKGLKVCLIEKDLIGGTCLNRGCIPTKTLIQSAKIFQYVKKSANFGIESHGPLINFAKVQERKSQIISLLSRGMQSRIKDIDLVKSSARIISAQKIKIEGGEIGAKYILIASGSKAFELESFKFSRNIISSDEALSLSEIPASILVIGGGFIGCEFASLFNILGSQVTIAEKLPFLLPGQDSDISRKIEAIFKKKGIKVVTSADISAFDAGNYSKTLVCVGRVAETSGLGIEELGIETEKGRIIVNDNLKTNIGNIYAAGDCASKIMLAHYAAYQGRASVESIVSNDSRKAYNRTIPACVFTDPQISAVGLSEANALAAGISIKVQKFDFLGSGMARIMDEAEGFIKIISDPQTGSVLGSSIIGPLACELIAIAQLAVSAGLSVEQLSRNIFAHPSLGESFYDCVNN